VSMAQSKPGRSRGTAAPSLSADSLSHEFGPRAPVAARCIGCLYEESVVPVAEPPAKGVLEELARALHLPDGMESARLLAACRAYYALVVQRVVVALVGSERAASLLGGMWLAGSGGDELTGVLDCGLAGRDLTPDDDPIKGRDLFKAWYEALFPRRLRHALGEYYTPDWLVTHVLDQLDCRRDPCRRLLDPTCGSGSFLLAAIARLRSTWGGSPGELLEAVVDRFVGCEVNPLAVLTARANYLLAVRDLLPGKELQALPIYLCDVIRDPPPDGRPFDDVAGNPPWIAWDHLPDEYRAATKPLWLHYGLFSLSAKEARHGGGKKDLAALLTYVVADRYLRDGGRMALVVPQTLFQTKGAGAGFRRFRLGAEGAPLCVQRVDDLVAVRPFAPASNWTSVIVLEKGRPTEYPLPYRKWSPVPSVRRRSAGLRPEMDCEACVARPADPSRLDSPWLVVPEVGHTPRPGKAEYQAHLGANSGGANGVYWLEVLEAGPQGLRVRNVGQRGKHAVPEVETWLESDLVFPLLRWGDVERYRARPSLAILLCQDTQTRRGLDERQMADRHSRTLAYLARFRELLCQRAAYRRYQGHAAFYSMYNVGSYTLSEWKVVWRRMDRRIRAAVVGPCVMAGELAPRPVVPQETCVLVAVEDLDEAHYLCALLNSQAADRLARGFSVDGGKGFGTPGMLDFLPIRRYDPDDTRHRALAAHCRQAHVAAATGVPVEPFQGEIDRLAAELWETNP